MYLAEGGRESTMRRLQQIAASLRQAAGLPRYQVSRWLGHATTITTDTIFSHLYPTEDSQRGARFEAFAAGR